MMKTEISEKAQFGVKPNAANKQELATHDYSVRGWRALTLFCLVPVLFAIGNHFYGSVATAHGSHRNCKSTAHPNHFSSAEVRWNEKTGNFEIALSVWPADLEKAISQLDGRTVDLEKTKGLDNLIALYVSNKFRLRKVAPETLRKPSVSEPIHAPEIPQATTKPKMVPGKEGIEEPFKNHVHSPGSNPLSTGPDSNTSKSEDHLVADSAERPRNNKTHEPTLQHPDDNPVAQTNSVSAGDTTPPVSKLPDGFRWVGFESNAKEAWLYFEVAGDIEPAIWEVENRVFFEFNEEQVNQIRLTFGNQTRSHSLKINQPTWQFSTESSKLRDIEKPESRR